MTSTENAQCCSFLLVVTAGRTAHASGGTLVTVLSPSWLSSRAVTNGPGQGRGKVCLTFLGPVSFSEVSFPGSTAVALGLPWHWELSPVQLESELYTQSLWVPVW